MHFFRNAALTGNVKKPVLDDDEDWIQVKKIKGDDIKIELIAAYPDVDCNTFKKGRLKRVKEADPENCFSLQELMLKHRRQEFADFVLTHDYDKTNRVWNMKRG